MGTTCVILILVLVFFSSINQTDLDCLGEQCFIVFFLIATKRSMIWENMIPKNLKKLEMPADVPDLTLIMAIQSENQSQVCYYDSYRPICQRSFLFKGKAIAVTSIHPLIDGHFESAILKILKLLSFWKSAIFKTSLMSFFIISFHEQFWPSSWGFQATVRFLYKVLTPSSSDTSSEFLFIVWISIPFQT